MKITRKEKKVLFNRLFKGLELKQGDVIIFTQRGKKLWRVEWKTDKGASLISLGTKWSTRYIYPKDHRRVRKVEGAELVQWILRNRPGYLPKIIKDQKKRIKLLRKLIPKPEGLEDIEI